MIDSSQTFLVTPIILVVLQVANFAFVNYTPRVKKIQLNWSNFEYSYKRKMGHSILQWAIDFLRMREKQSNITSCRPNCAISIENNDMSLFVKFTGLNFFLTTGVELYLRCLQNVVVSPPNVGHIAAFICGTIQGNFTPRWVTVPLVRLNYCQIFDGFLKKKNDIENTFT